MIDAGPALCAIASNWSRDSAQMNEKSLSGIAFLRMIFGFARTGGQFTLSTGQLSTNRLKK
jgi:hypothetical protein